MEYEREKFMLKCQDSLSGLPPIALKAPINLRPEQIDRDNPQDTLRLFPGYAQYQQKRSGPLGEAFLQKAPRYNAEEEVRIVHYPKEVHEKSLRMAQIKGETKAVLPLVINDGHLIEEIIIGQRSQMKKRQIVGILRQSGMYAPIKAIDESELK